MALADITAVLICRNSGATLARTLASLEGFLDVVVYENGSTDNTAEVARQFANVRLVEGEFRGFGPTKNAAVDCARSDWVLSIDSDEWLDEALRSALDAADLSDPRRAYAVLRQNLFLGQHVRRGGWQNDWLLRLYNRTATRFSEAAVHEQVVAPPGGSVSRLEGVLWHDAVRDIDQFLHKISLYSTLAAEEPGARRVPALLLLPKAVWAFLRSYLFRLGFLAGWRGMVIAFSESCGTFFKYAKRHARHQSDGS